jgi:hypothetical protein
MADKIFAQGFDVKLPNEKAPDFIRMRLGFKVAEFSAFFAQHENNNGWVNVDVLLSKDGTKLYGVLNDYKPERPDVVKEEPVIEYPGDEVSAADLPF